MRQKEEAGGERWKGMATANQREDPESPGHLRRTTLKLRTEGKLSPRRNWQENAGSLALQSWTRK